MTENDNRRPYPPVNFTGENWLPYTRLIPATEIGEWVNQNILSEEGRIHNPDHTPSMLMSRSCGPLAHSPKAGALCWVSVSR
jgi:hypothetical protein